MTREDFLKRIRDALAHPLDHSEEAVPLGSPPSPPPPAPHDEPGRLAERFTAELIAAGGQVHRVNDLGEARTALRDILETSGARSLITTDEAIVQEVLDTSLPRATDPALADVGISGVRAALAETGTLLLDSSAGRKPQLLPMTYVTLIHAEQLRPSMTEALAEVSELPSALVLVTGPSRTADIELTLTTGVHGPGVVHAILIG